MLRRPGRSEGLLAKTAGAERSAGKAPQKISRRCGAKLLCLSKGKVAFTDFPLVMPGLLLF